MIRKTMKAILWVALIIVFLFIIVAALIQIPAIQTKIVRFATTFVSNKTHTKVELEKVSISFPKSILIEELYLEDTQKDTLLYAGRAKVNIALFDLFLNKITISSFTLDDATINLYSTKTNPSFNYNFLTTAFSDTTNQEQTEPLTESKWIFKIDKVFLQNFRLLYNDNYAAMSVNIEIQKSKFNVDQIDLGKSIYKIDEMLMDGLKVIVQQTATANILNSNSNSVMPNISVQKLELNNSKVHYADSVGFLSLMAIINQCKLEEGFIDLETERITVAAIDLSKSDIQYRDFAPELDSIAVISSSSNNWKVAVAKMKMNENSFLYRIGNKPDLKNEFNAEHLEFNKMNVNAIDFYYDSDLIKISVQKFSAINQDNFVINSLATDFSMDEQSITTKNLKLNTPNTTIDADFYIQYASLDSFTKNYQFSDMNLNMRNVSFKNHDVLYFSPDLIEQPFFKNNKTSTSITGKVNGPMNHLTGKKLALKTGQNTFLETDLSISGLPEMKTALFDFPNLKIRTGKNDLLILAGSSIPENIGLPENISLQIAFKGKLNSFETEAKMTSSFGDANFTAAIDATENFNGKAKLSNLNLGKLLKDTIFYGPVSLTAETKGQGLNMKTVTAQIKAEATQLYLNQYNYQKLSINGTVSGKQFEGTINLDDENAEFDFDGLVNLNPDQEQYKFSLKMLGADLKKLHFIEKDIRMSFTAEANFKGNGLNNLNGTAGVNNIVIVNDEKTYKLESFLSASVNEPQRSEFNINSALIGIKYLGTVSLATLPSVLRQFINNYFPVSDSIPQKTKSEQSLFNFEIQLHNHPILSEVLFPGLNEFIPGIITGSFDSEKNDLKLNASVNKIVYGTTEFKDLAISVNSDLTALNYKISIAEIAYQQFGLTHLLVDGKVADNKISTSISSIDNDQNKKLMVGTQITKDTANFNFSIDPANFYLMNKHWNIAADNYIEFGKQGVLIHNLTLNNAESQLTIASVNDRFNDDLNIGIQNFKLQDLSGIVAKDSALVEGTIDGNVLLKRVNESYGIIADANVANLFLHNIPIGDLTLNAENASQEKFNIDLNLSGAHNKLSAKGYYLPNGGANSINIKTVIESLSMKTVEAFSMGQITEAEGILSGNFVVNGNTSTPGITGELVFNNAFLNPAFLNNRIELKHEVIQLKDDGIYFNNFTLFDAKENTAVLNGAVKMQQFSNFKFAFSVTTKDFLLFNTTAKDNDEFFGQMIIDSKIDVSGSMLLPIVKAQLKMKKGSNFTFVVPDNQLTTDKGEGVVEFETEEQLNPFLYRNDKIEAQKSSLSGFDVAAIIEIDKEATLRLLMDPASTDSLVVKGEAALSFTMDQSGNMSLTGAYNLSEGSYLVSLESIIKRQFDIDAGSTIIWNGDPLDANISINAEYKLRTSPYDLVADQLGMNEDDKSQYKQRYPFIVMLKLRGKILQPEISFEIQLPPDEKGILGGPVNQKLSLLNEDPSALNKQVFALLVLGRFIKVNHLQAEMVGASTLIRTTVSKFLSAQLNQLSSKVIPGVELNFDIQSYDDYQSGQAQGRTQVEIGMKKQLFNERLSVQLGGTVDVEGDKAKQNSASDITSDVTVEYELNREGSFRLKGFRHNQYEGAIEGQLVETGVGVVFVKDFNSWKRAFRMKKRPPKSKGNKE
ncbi:MAG: translocation/assembly module TamB [Prolixibacteraceae bacterium]|nr:translocation/assembly module TamB [Prolixibacteraceae bacterium]